MKSLAVVVRPATRADLDDLLRLYVQLDPANASTDREIAARALETMLAREGVHLLVATADDVVVATVTLVVVPSLTHNAKPLAEIETLVVDAAARSNRIGRALIEECLRIASEAGCYKVSVQTGNDDREPDARTFYQHIGFEATHVGFRIYLADR